MTLLERLFCESYVKLRDATEAALVAGYKPSTARVAGDILARAHVQEYINTLSMQIEERAVKKGTDVVNEISKIAFMDTTGLIKPDPDSPDQFIFKSPDELTPDQKAAIASIHIHEYEVEVGTKKNPRTETRQSFTYTLHDKSKALEAMGKHFEIFGHAPGTSVTLNRFSNLSDDVLFKLEAQLQDALEGTYEVLEDGSRLPDARRSQH